MKNEEPLQKRKKIGGLGIWCGGIFPAKVKSTFPLLIYRLFGHLYVLSFSLCY